MPLVARRGYLWEKLPEEIVAEFAQVHPLLCMVSVIPFRGHTGWHIEGALGDMSGMRQSLKHRRGEPSTPSVRDLRARRRLAGMCIDCGAIRHPRSKSYCAKHRELDRQRAAQKRATKKPKE